MSHAELYHHGIRGQKWGVRRFQNRDGSLTPEGRKRYSETIDIKRDRMQMDTIKEGTTINRVANVGETLDSKRKYVSITPRDKKTYESDMMEGMLGGDINKSFGAYEYKANKDLKVASGKDVTEYAINKYGDKITKQLYRALESLGYMDTYMFFDRDTEAGKEIDEVQSQLSSAVRNIMEKNINDVANTYIKKGYDAMVDIEDWGYADFPLVVLNPENSLTLEKYTKIWD